MTKELIIVFVKNIKLGKVKTRLAKTIGNATALKIYIFLLERTRDISVKVSADKAVYYSVKVRENDIWGASIFQKHQQVGEDLGIRM